MAESEKLYGRKYLVTIRDMRVDNLRCTFRVTKNLKPEPNQLELKIYNLAPNQRRALENIPPRPADVTLARLIGDAASNNVVRLEAGYEDGTSLLYLGEVRAAHSITEGPNIVTEVTSGDGEADLQGTRIHVPLGPGTPIDQALSAIVKALGCGEGNLATMLPALKLSGKAEMFVKGSVLSGSAADELDGFCKSANLEWSIQNGKLLLLDRGKAQAGVALVMSADSGLIESPTVDSKGVVSFKTLMIPSLYPGRAVVFRSKHLSGGYRVEECVYQGDTEGKEWYIDCKAKKIK